MDEQDRTAETESRGYDRRRFLRNAALGAGGLTAGTMLGGLGSSASASSLPRSMTLPLAARRGGALNVIALPPTWANYGNIISTFERKYGVKVNSANPNGTSAEELSAITSLKGQSNEPDVVDVAPSIANTGVAEKAFAPYKVSTWNTIPANMKNPKGYWYGDYYGVVSFGTNLSVQKTPPRSWKELLNPRYKGQVAIDGDPRSAGDAFGAVFAAALAHGGSLDNIMPGIEFFKELKDRGNFNATDCYPANISKGTTPVAIVWDYLNLGYKTTPAVFAKPSDYAVVIPSDGKFGNYYCQAISAYAPHKANAELWEEFIYSDEGQLLYLAGFAHPARYANLAAEHKIPAALARKLPPPSEYKGVVFPNQAQTNKAAAVLAAHWGPIMGVA